MPTTTVGLITPFRRDQKSDFANGTGSRVLAANVAQVLGTRCGNETEAGELPWDSEFGSRLHSLRHRNPNATTHELARHFVIEALAKWEPRARVSSAKMVVDGRRRYIRVLFREVDQTGAPLGDDQTVDVDV